MLNDPASIIVCDAGPLIHLDELNCLFLLTDFHSVLVPGQVWEEVRHHRPSALTASYLKRVDVNISTISRFQLLVHAFSLDIGEQAALSLVHDYPDAILLTDDAAARLASSALGYNVHGTIGIIVRAIRRNQLSHAEVKGILSTLPSHSTLHIRSSFLQEIIDSIDP